MIIGIIIYLTIGTGISIVDHQVVDGFADQSRPFIESTKLTVGYPIYFINNQLK